MTPAQLLALIVLVDIRSVRRRNGTLIPELLEAEARAFALLDNQSGTSIESLLATAERMRAEEVERK